MSFFSLNQRSGALLSIFIIVCVWGSASSVTKLSVENTPPYVFAFLRNLVASTSLLIFYLYRRKRNNIKPMIAPFRKVVWMGLTGITFFYLFFNIALYYTTAAAGALIQGFIPVAIILLAILFLKERLTGLQAGGILLSVCGVIMIGFVGEMTGARNSVLGNILMIFAVLSWGAYTIISKSMKQYDAIYLTTITTLVGTAGLIPAVVIELWNRPSFPAISLNAWLSILYLGLLSSSVCYILYNKVLKVLSGVQVGNFMNLDPIIGAVIAVLVLDERVTIWQIIGTVLVLGGVTVTSMKAPKPPKGGFRSV
jgi:drug/metabolite transporter (DMT)-like permease